MMDRVTELRMRLKIREQLDAMKVDERRLLFSELLCEFGRPRRGPHGAYRAYSTTETNEAIRAALANGPMTKKEISKKVGRDCAQRIAALESNGHITFNFETGMFSLRKIQINDEPKKTSDDKNAES